MNDDAARSAAMLLTSESMRLPHTEAVSECLHCNALFLATWALKVLGPAAERQAPPGPPNPPLPNREARHQECQHCGGDGKAITGEHRVNGRVVSFQTKTCEVCNGTGIVQVLAASDNS